MNLFQKLNSKVTASLAGLVAMVTGSSAFAAIPVEVTAAFTELSADLVIVGGLVVVATVGVAVWKFVQAIII